MRSTSHIPLYTALAEGDVAQAKSILSVLRNDIFGSEHWGRHDAALATIPANEVLIAALALGKEPMGRERDVLDILHTMLRKGLRLDRGVMEDDLGDTGNVLVSSGLSTCALQDFCLAGGMTLYSPVILSRHAAASHQTLPLWQVLALQAAKCGNAPEVYARLKQAQAEGAAIEARSDTDPASTASFGRTNFFDTLVYNSASSEALRQCGPEVVGACLRTGVDLTAFDAAVGARHNEVFKQFKLKASRQSGLGEMQAVLQELCAPSIGAAENRLRGGASADVAEDCTVVVAGGVLPRLIGESRRNPALVHSLMVGTEALSPYYREKYRNVLNALPRTLPLAEEAKDSALAGRASGGVT